MHRHVTFLAVWLAIIGCAIAISADDTDSDLRKSAVRCPTNDNSAATRDQTGPDDAFADVEVLLTYKQIVQTSGDGGKPKRTSRRLVAILGLPSLKLAVQKLARGSWGRTPHDSFDGDGIGIPELGVVFLSGPLPAMFPEGRIVDDGLLARLAGLRHLESLRVDLTDVTDRGVTSLAGSSRLQALSLGGTLVTDEGMRTIGKLTTLTVLALYDTSVTDSGLKELRNLSALQELSLGGTQVTGSAFSDLGGMTSLEVVYLHGTPFDDDGCVNLCKLESIRTLSLGQTRVTDRGAAAIAALRNLQDLDLGGTRVTDATLRKLAACPTLKRLCIDHTGVTDAGIAALAELKSLRVLDARGTRVTREALAQLRMKNGKLGIQEPLAASVRDPARPVNAELQERANDGPRRRGIKRPPGDSQESLQAFINRLEALTRDVPRRD